MTEYKKITDTDKGIEAVIYYDPYCESPRSSMDNMWNFVSNMKRSSDLNEGELSLDDLMQKRKTLAKDYIIVNVYAYIHSGIALSLQPFHCPWDSGLGFVAYVSKEALREEYGVKRINDKTLERAMNVLKGEVEMLGEWMDGNCFYVEVKTTEDDEIYDSCGGFYGSESAEEYAQEIVDGYQPEGEDEQTSTPETSKIKYA